MFTLAQPLHPKTSEKTQTVSWRAYSNSFSRWRSWFFNLH